MLRYAKTSLLSLLLIAFLAGSTVTYSQLAGDLNKDYRVNSKDLRIFAWQWLDPNCLVPGCLADLDGANGVNFSDLAILAQDWQIEEPHPVISEIMAINEIALSTTVEGRIVYPDWIEIYNPTATTVNLDGWYLTDEEDKRAKWGFPDVSIESNNYLRVFASGIQSEDHPENNPYIDDDGFYHTNFELDGDGDYLALVCQASRWCMNIIHTSMGRTSMVIHHRQRTFLMVSI
jgi:hypothetical protein